ncbi:cellulose biosynthesis cyclic di-GMP-binding regulatory protein BcsB [Paenibacillus sp. NPDC056579]|uniref:cellulose biosynthesis cyclic di-GMP-binding regulatory protein BcsB n=1 Tax=Paenibacillus sp. NPDC056579 TaxID=3345871 RepID=UPI00367E54A4
MKRLLLITSVCLSLLVPQMALAVEAADGSAPLVKNYGTVLSDTSLSGGFTSTEQFFRVEDYWKVDSVTLQLDYKTSTLTQTERSSVTLLINGSPFHSFRPTVGDADMQRLNVTVPAALIVPGVNTLSIQGHLETTVPNPNLVCLPTTNRDNWLHILDSSAINVKHSNEAMKNSIRDFNRRFIGMDTTNDGLNAVAVSEKGHPAELEAAVYALSGFAKASPVKDKVIPLVPYGEETLKGKQAVVAIALYDNLSPSLKPLLSRSDVQDKALIQLVRMADQPTLVITSSDPGLLIKAGRLAANQSLLGQLDADTKVVDSTTEVATPQVDVSRNVTLTEAGDKLTGALHREKTYFIALPGNRSIADASKLSLDFRYARNLDFSRSMVTVLIDKTPIGSKKLSTELANGDHMEMTIPKDLNISGNFSVTVAFDLELEDAGCIDTQDQMPWAFIDKKSMLQLNTKDRAELLLNNYPYPLLRDGSYNQVAVVLPKERESYTYATLTNLFNLLGQYAQTNTGEVRFFDDAVSADNLKARQVIAIGSYRDNKIIRDNNDKLYFKYDPNGGGFVSNEKMSIDADYGKRIGTLQLIDSPYEAGSGLLAVTGSGAEYTYLASKMLAVEGTLWKVFGDGVVADKDGNVQAFRFKKQAEPEGPSTIGNILERRDVLGFMVAVILVIVLVLVSLILMVRKYRKKRGKEQ